jgi:hypothetical protein
MPYEKSLIKDLFGRKGKKAEKGKTEWRRPPFYYCLKTKNQINLKYLTKNILADHKRVGKFFLPFSYGQLKPDWPNILILCIFLYKSFFSLIYFLFFGGIQIMSAWIIKWLYVSFHFCSKQFWGLNLILIVL